VDSSVIWASPKAPFLGFATLTHCGLILNLGLKDGLKPMVDSAPVDWFEEGQRQFVVSKIKPGAAPIHYPTQDRHLPKDEADYIKGYAAQAAEWGSGKGFGMMEGYAHEVEAERKREIEERRKATGE
jgi:hypothetical protein